MFSFKSPRRALLVALLSLPFISLPVSADGGRLTGSRASQAKQNKVADRHDLTRIKNTPQLRKFIRAGLLVAVGDTDAYVIDKTLGEMDPDNADLYAHARPWVKQFLDDILGEGHRELGIRFTVTSLVRTKAYQKRLRKHNSYAASGKSWWRQSSHLTGSTVDISYLDLDEKATAWLAKRLAAHEKRGLIEATKEGGKQACFHVMVFPEYAKAKVSKTKVKKAKKKTKHRARR